jgi:hypothetical protein
MLRLKREDFEERVELTRLAQAANMTAQELKKAFAYLVEGEPRGSLYPMAAAPPPGER